MTTRKNLEEAFTQAFPPESTPPDALHARVVSIAEESERLRVKKPQASGWQWKKRYGFALAFVGITGMCTYPFLQNTIAPTEKTSLFQRQKKIHLVKRYWRDAKLVSRIELWKEDNNWAYDMGYSRSFRKNKATGFTIGQAIINGVFYSSYIYGSYIKDTSPGMEVMIPHDIKSIDGILKSINVSDKKTGIVENTLNSEQEANNNIVFEKDGKKMRQYMVNGHTVWCDEQTHLPVRIVYSNISKNLRTNTVTVVSKDETIISYDETPPRDAFRLTKEMQEAKDINLARPLLQEKLNHPVLIKTLNQTEIRVLSFDVNKQGDIFMIYALPENVEFHNSDFNCSIKNSLGRVYDDYNLIDYRFDLKNWHIYTVFGLNRVNNFSPESIFLKIDGTYIKVKSPLANVKIPVVDYPLWTDVDQKDVVLTFNTTAPTCDVVPEIVCLGAIDKDPISTWQKAQLRYRQHSTQEQRLQSRP
jgi:hypothetical protein